MGYDSTYTWKSCIVTLDFSFFRTFIKKLEIYNKNNNNNNQIIIFYILVPCKIFKVQNFLLKKYKILYKNGHFYEFLFKKKSIYIGYGMVSTEKKSKKYILQRKKIKRWVIFATVITQHVSSNP